METELMCKNKSIAKLDRETGIAHVKSPELMPLNLDFRETCHSLSDNLHNLQAFDNWCADRVISIDRKYAKQILNTLGLSQSQSIADKAEIARSYRCLSLQDAFWIRSIHESIEWEDVNLFTNSFSNAMVPVSLLGGSITLTNRYLNEGYPDLSTNGTYAKAWMRRNNEIFLFKADDTYESDETLREVGASQILDAFDIPHVQYWMDHFDNLRVAACKCMTNENTSIVPFRHFRLFCERNHCDPIEEIKKVDPDGYYRMNIATYLIGNTDNHDGNWGLYRDNNTGQFLGIHPLFDFNNAFYGYAFENGGNCIPEMTIIKHGLNELFDWTYEPTKSQQEAAIEAIQHVTIEAKSSVMRSSFLNDNDCDEFCARCNRLGIAIEVVEDRNYFDRLFEEDYER